jgi:uncharacterized protein YecE (DUF72 family)
MVTRNPQGRLDGERTGGAGRRVRAPRFFVGTAGWSIPRRWVGAFPDYGSGLEKYARVIGAVELDSTFSRRHRASTFEKWRDAVPPSFRFAVKMPKAITHDAALASPRRELGEFFDDVRGLGEKLGPVLVQLPASQTFERRRTATFFRILRTLHAGPVVCEPRHTSWYTETASSVLIDHDVARVVADPPRPEPAAIPGGSPSLVYFRWHGSPGRYWSNYDDERLSRMSRQVLEAATRCPVWCIFDNTAAGAATGNALTFVSLLDAQRTGVRSAAVLARGRR